MVFSSPGGASACSPPDTWSVAAAFDLAANGELPASYPQIPASTGVHGVPPTLLKAVGWLESRWQQFSSRGQPLISFDFGYGIMQITSGMAGSLGDPDGTLDPRIQSRIASDYTFNIAFGARVLAGKRASTPQIGDGDPSVIETWYYALWAYNGWGWMNNPNNPRFSRTGNPVTNPTGFPYQERVLYLVAHPPKDRDGVPLWPAIQVSLPSRKSIGNGPHALPQVAHPHRQPPPPFSAVYRTGALGPVEAGGRRTIAVRITNTGTATWGAPGTDNISLTYHLLTADADPSAPISPVSPGVLAFGQGVVPITASVPPGASVTVRETIFFPATAGRYQVVWDMQRGAAASFSQLGGFPRAQRVVVLSRGIPTPTPTHAAPATSTPQYGLRYVADTSIRDGATLAPDQRVTKGWLVFNDGRSAWAPGWTLRLVAGKSFGAPPIPVPTLGPCRAWTVTAILKAPKKPGHYTSAWRLQIAPRQMVGDRLTLVVDVRAAPSATPTPPARGTPTPGAVGKPLATPTPAG